MTVGKRIFSDNTTGDVFFEIQKQPNATETTVEQDIATFKILSERNRDSFDVLELEYGQYADLFAQYPYHIYPATKSIVWGPNAFGQSLDDVKAAKMDQLKIAAAIALGTVTSSALGTAHTYLTGYGSGNTDFLMLKTEDDFMQSADWDGQNILWYTLEAGDVEHTKEQIHQVFLDARASGQDKKFKAKNLLEQVAAVQIGTGTEQAAIDAVNAIVW